MKASSESGLWATRMVWTMSLPRAHAGGRADPEVIEDGLVLLVFGLCGAELCVVMREEVPVTFREGRSIVASVGHFSTQHVREEMSRRSGLDRVGEGERGGQVTHGQMDQRGVKPQVAVHTVEHGVGAERHRGKLLDRDRIAFLAGAHHPVEEPIEAFPWRHLADIRCWPRESG